MLFTIFYGDMCSVLSLGNACNKYEKIRKMVMPTCFKLYLSKTASCVYFVVHLIIFEMVCLWYILAKDTV